MSRILVLALVAGLLALPGSAARAESCAPTPHPGGEWRMFGHDLAGTRHQDQENVIDPVKAATLAPAWTFDANAASGATNNEITGYPIVADGCVYVGSSTGNQRKGFVFAINADTGRQVWAKELSHGVYSTLAVEGGRVFAFVSRVRHSQILERDKGPYVIALDQATGAKLWETEVDQQFGSDAVSSPIVFDGMVWVGVSGTAAEGDEADRFAFQGNFVLLDAVTGGIIRKTYSIPPEQWAQEYAGAAMWATIAIDRETKYGYVGTGNPFNYDAEHERSNAIVKIDLDPNRPTFGQIVDSYKGNVERYFPPVQDNFSCDEEDPIGFFLAGFECGNLDLDFGSQPNVYLDSNGRKIVASGQKSGVFHAVDPETMDPVWTTLMGVPSLVGGIVGSAAYDGANLYSPHTIGGYLASLDKDSGAINWVSPTADAIHWGPPAIYANGVLYTPDLKGFLDAYDAATGAPLLHRPMGLGAATGADPTLSWAGATVARNTVYASVGVGLSSVGENPPWPQLPNGFVIAFRPAL